MISGHMTNGDRMWACPVQQIFLYAREYYVDFMYSDFREQQPIGVKTLANDTWGNFLSNFAWALSH